MEDRITLDMIDRGARRLYDASPHYRWKSGFDNLTQVQKVSFWSKARMILAAALPDAEIDDGWPET